MAVVRKTYNTEWDKLHHIQTLLSRNRGTWGQKNLIKSLGIDWNHRVITIYSVYIQVASANFFPLRYFHSLFPLLISRNLKAHSIHCPLYCHVWFFFSHSFELVAYNVNCSLAKFVFQLSPLLPVLPSFSFVSNVFAWSLHKKRERRRQKNESSIYRNCFNSFDFKQHLAICFWIPCVCTIAISAVGSDSHTQTHKKNLYPPFFGRIHR